MNRNKFFVILATVVLLVAAACSGGFQEPGTLASISGSNSGLTGGGVTGRGTPASGGGSGGGGVFGGKGGFGGGYGNAGTFTVTDIPSKYNGMYADVGGASYGLDIIVSGYPDLLNSNDVLCPISNGKVIAQMWMMLIDDPINDLKGYSGNDTLTITFEIYATNVYSGGTIKATASFDSVKFSKGSATVSWNQVSYVYEY